ncbi:V-type ATP synthase subunit A [candidate division KSB1 bacterium]|nr:V-type ATP synthase subunit A [candidate division KSB1 bacterium]
MSPSTGKIVGISGNMVTVEFDGNIMQNEVAYILKGEERLKSEIVRIGDSVAFMQVFESTKGLKIGDKVEFSGELLSVQLGPGLLGQVYDGLQNPLPDLAEEYGFFLPRGVELKALDDERKWKFTPVANKGDTVIQGMLLGHVPEGIFEHAIMVPFHLPGEYTVEDIAAEGEYAIKETIAKIKDEKGNTHEISMTFNWPVKIPIEAYRDKIVPEEPLVTQARIIDTFFPVAKGGTFCIPGPFGAGKTVLQHILSRHAQVDVVIVAACGERAGEVVELLREFPELEDPRTGKTLMERTIIICNTSSMPVAAREASVYTAVTLGEYYKQMGLDVLLLADSTSRWAQAMRELSGRLEEIPGEEAFPAYLESRIAEFYERSGLMELNSGEYGSLTIGGTVSPAGGNFEEPVTQATLKVVGAFLGLSRDRANARRFPSIHPLESWSKYESFIDQKNIDEATDKLRRGNDVNQMMMVVGEEGTSIEDFQLYLKSEFLDSVYLQQNAFDEVDAATNKERQTHVFQRVQQVLDTDFHLESKDQARDLFNRLRQLFIDWNYAKMDSPDFKQIEESIEKLIKEHSENEENLQ